MADISKCNGMLDGGMEGYIRCWHRDRCYRFTAPAADVFQSWIAPVIREDGSCAKFVSDDTPRIDSKQADAEKSEGTERVLRNSGSFKDDVQLLIDDEFHEDSSVNVRDVLLRLDEAMMDGHDARAMEGGE